MSYCKYTKEMLEPLVAGSTTWAEVCRKVGITPMTGAQTHLKKVCLRFGLAYAHFVGKSWNKGRSFPKKPLREYLKKDSTIHSDSLRRCLISEGVKKAECEQCRLVEWLGEPIDLELDHINSDHFDNRLINLRLLCPNCHARKTRKVREQRKNEKVVV